MASKNKICFDEDDWEPLSSLICLRRLIQEAVTPKRTWHKILSEIDSLIEEFRRRVPKRERQLALMTRLFVHLGDEGWLGPKAGAEVSVPPDDDEL